MSEKTPPEASLDTTTKGHAVPAPVVGPFLALWRRLGFHRPEYQRGVGSLGGRDRSATKKARPRTETLKRRKAGRKARQAHDRLAKARR